ncbi:MAG TPA: alpha/beta fold hydrolase [Syntrophales bacterium]|nr:alpha/beta fold hydrolase [Syntrophales bacterium]
MSQPIRVFIHGLESTSQGTKGVWFRERYPGMIIGDYRGSLAERMEVLRERLEGRENLILVGSSYGGLMAALFACASPERVRRLVLLAPALHLDEFAPCLDRRIGMPVSLYHGSFDDVVPPGPVREIAGRVFSDLTYHLLEDDHSIHRNFPLLPWDLLLEVR